MQTFRWCHDFQWLFLVYVNDLHMPRVYLQTMHVYCSLQINCSLETYMNHDLDKFRI